jgi:pilus assembly protein CpaF
MFTIIISEKGGAERRETFEKNEINVGRVQGNDLMLPKGNVSKHHARLLFRDGRFIVTDLKSTNGTYVNGRKIAQATIVREGDKIYIGDFVLRLDAGAQSAPADADAYAPPEPPRQARPDARAPSLGTASAARMDPNLGDRYTDPREPRDQDDSEPQPPPERPAPMPRVPAPPRVPAIGAGAAGVAGGGASTSPGASGAPRGGGTMVLGNQARPNHAAATSASHVMPSPRGHGNSTAAASSTSHAAPAGPAAGGAPYERPALPARVPPRESPAQAARRLALITLLDRVADVVDLAPFHTGQAGEAQGASLDRALREQAKAMKDEGEAPEGVDADVLVGDAVRELSGFGPIGPLLDDDDVLEVQCLRHDQVVVSRADGSVTLADASFTSEEAFVRVILRLARSSGEAATDAFIDRRLPRGAHVAAVLPPASTAPALVLRKRRRVEATLEDLVRDGVLSRPMAVFLEHCVAGRANVLVCGSGPEASTVVAALATAGAAGERVASVHVDDDYVLAHAQSVVLAAPDFDQAGADALRAAAALRPDRLIVGSLQGALVPSLVDAVCGGAEAVLAVVPAPTLRQALSRLATRLTSVRPGVPLDAAREQISDVFDVAVEVVRGGDGRARVLRIAELGGADAKGVAVKDVFTLAESGATGDASFVPSGVVPRIVAELGARGLKMDPGLFRRTAARN